MNFGVLLLPNYRASTTAFVLGLAFIAALDGLRTSLGLPWYGNLVGNLFVFWCVFSLHSNRRRHANKGTGLGLLPPILAVLAAAIAGMVEFMGQMVQHMTEFASANGVDPDDVQAFTAALNDPAFQAAWQENITENPEVLESWMPGMVWATYGGFWVVVAGFALWFSGMKSAGGAMADLRRPPEQTPVSPAVDTPAADKDQDSKPQDGSEASEPSSDETSDTVAPSPDGPSDTSEGKKESEDDSGGKPSGDS